MSIFVHKNLIGNSRKILSGARSILSGVFGVASSLDHAMLDLRFWIESRDWDLCFGPMYGEAGTTTVLVVAPQCFFRGEKIIATDTAEKPGRGTRITQVLIGQRLQRPATGGGSLTAFFASNAIGNGVTWDTCEPAFSIAVTVSFIEACTFDMNIFGRAIV